VPGQEIERILTDLGFGVEATANPEGEDGWSCEVPSWRHDVVGEADLVEEVVRIHGYDNIPIVPLERESALPKPAVNGSQERRNLARRALAGRGITEAVTFSFLPSAQAALFGGGAEELNLVNPISADLDVMRPSLLPNLIAAAGRNADRGHKDLALFEIGPQYAGAAPGDQSFAAGGIRAGGSGPRHWAAAPRHVDVFDAKADALAVLEAIGAPVASLQVFAEAPSWFHPGRSGTLRLGPQKVLAAFGEIHPGTLAQMDVAGPVAGFEIFLDELPPAKAGKGKARATLELSPYQAVERDFAFIVDDTVSADSVVRAAQGADKNLITEVSLFDLFAGPELGDGKKSLAISVVLQPTEATLTDAQIDAVSNKVVAAVTKATGGTLRG